MLTTLRLSPYLLTLLPEEEGRKTGETAGPAETKAGQYIPKLVVNIQIEKKL